MHGYMSGWRFFRGEAIAQGQNFWRQGYSSGKNILKARLYVGVEILQGYSLEPKFSGGKAIVQAKIF
jgi:hypothetical protein